MRELGTIAFSCFAVVFFVTALTAIGLSIAKRHVLLFPVLIPIELSLVSFAGEVSRASYGTCVGYALIVQPTKPNELFEESPTLQPRRARLLKHFKHHSFPLIQYLRNFFDEYSIYNSQGLNQIWDPPVAGEETVPDYDSDTYVSLREQVLDDLMSFFKQRLATTSTRFSTYILYYCGPTEANGDWKLSEDTVLDLKTLLTLWQSVLEEEGLDTNKCRLLLLVDAPNSRAWYWQLLKMRTKLSVAIQSAELVRDKPYSYGIWPFQTRKQHWCFSIGEFSRRWITWNIRYSKQRPSRYSNLEREESFDECTSSTDPLMGSPTRRNEPAMHAFFIATDDWSKQMPASFTNLELRDFCLKHIPTFFGEVLSIMYYSQELDRHRVTTLKKITDYIVTTRLFILLSTIWLSIADLLWALYRRWIYFYRALNEIETVHGFRLCSEEL